jgi:ribose 5-phosphate isomerase B
MNWKKIAIGCDHAGFPYKEAIINFLQSSGLEVLNFGTNSAESVDYPDFVHPAMQAMDNKDAQAGILLCGSGNGVAMTANKYPEVRAALCWLPELARLARQHNNANVLCLPVRFISEADALACVEQFMQTAFEGGRHERRVCKISPIAAT